MIFFFFPFLFFSFFFFFLFSSFSSLVVQDPGCGCARILCGVLLRLDGLKCTEHLGLCLRRTAVVRQRLAEPLRSDRARAAIGAERPRPAVARHVPVPSDGDPPARQGGLRGAQGGEVRVRRENERQRVRPGSRIDAWGLARGLTTSTAFTFSFFPSTHEWIFFYYIFPVDFGCVWTFIFLLSGV
jgi:hypothetical protein